MLNFSGVSHSVVISSKTYNYLWNPWTGTNQFVTSIDTNSIQGSGVTISTTSGGVSIAATSISASSTSWVQNTLTPTTTTQTYTVQYGTVTTQLNVGSVNTAGPILFFEGDEAHSPYIKWREDLISANGLQFIKVSRTGSETLVAKMQDNAKFVVAGFETTGNLKINDFYIQRGGSQAMYLKDNNESAFEFSGGSTGFIEYVRMINSRAAANALGIEGASGQSAALVQLRGVSSTATRPQVDFDTAFSDSTDATRKSRGMLRVWDTSAREFLRADTDGSNAYTTLTGSCTHQGQVIFSSAVFDGSTSAGTSGQLLTSNGAGSAPTWTTVASGSTLLTSTNSWSGGNTFASSTTFTSTAAFSGPVMCSSGTAGICGSIKLVGGLGTVNTTRVTAKSIIQLTHQGSGGTLGHLFVNGITPNSSFAINSTSISDTSLVGWNIFEPNP